MKNIIFVNIFTGANLKTTRKGDVQFTLTHLNINLGARIWIKQYFTSLQEAKSPVYIYQPLLEAVSQGARKHVSIYAVIHSIIKVSTCLLFMFSNLISTAFMSSLSTATS